MTCNASLNLSSTCFNKSRTASKSHDSAMMSSEAQLPLLSGMGELFLGGPLRGSKGGGWGEELAAAVGACGELWRCETRLFNFPPPPPPPLLLWLLKANFGGSFQPGSGGEEEWRNGGAGRRNETYVPDMINGARLSHIPRTLPRSRHVLIAFRNTRYRIEYVHVRGLRSRSFAVWY